MTLAEEQRAGGSALAQLEPSEREGGGPGGAALVAESRPIPPSALAPLRELAYARGRVVERDGLTCLGLGTAATIELPSGIGAPGAAAAAEALLAGLAPRSPLSAIAALPFDPDRPATLVVPELLVRAEAGADPVAVACAGPQRLERLLAGFPFAAGAPAPERPEPLRPPDEFELRSIRSHEAFEDLVRAGLAALRGGDLQKVVLAREVRVTANRAFEQSHLLERLRALFPACTAFAVDGFVGASPELLVRRAGRSVHCEPLAGTVARSGDPDDDDARARALLASPKERREHALVVGAIVAALSGAGAGVEPPGEPHLFSMRNVSHLATSVRAALPGDAPPGALALLAAVHPTPAVCGVPTRAALEFIAAHEELDRGRYAGAVGLVDAGGDGEWWLGIRSAMVEGPVARLCAGVGIVEGSDPHEELVETQLKLQALLAAAVRP